MPVQTTQQNSNAYAGVNNPMGSGMSGGRRRRGSRKNCGTRRGRKSSKKCGTRRRKRSSRRH
jgi:hypothetical protein